MKTLLFCALLLVSSVYAAPDFILVTDIDDTIKITNMPHKGAAFKNAALTLKSFSGMSELYQEMVKDSQPFYVISGGPFVWKPRIKALLAHHDYPKAEKIKMRNVFKEKTFAFKVRVLSELIEEKKLPLILVGDDTEVDPYIFLEVQKNYPEHVLAIYIRQNVMKPLPLGVIPFSTSYEMALQEMKSGRLTESQVERVGQVVLDQENGERIFPWFVTCPNSFDRTTTMSSMVADKLEQICKDKIIERDSVEHQSQAKRPKGSPSRQE